MEHRHKRVAIVQYPVMIRDKRPFVDVSGKEKQEVPVTEMLGV